MNQFLLVYFGVSVHKSKEVKKKQRNWKSEKINIKQVDGFNELFLYYVNRMSLITGQNHNYYQSVFMRKKEQQLQTKHMYISLIADQFHNIVSSMIIENFYHIN